MNTIDRWPHKKKYWIVGRNAIGITPQDGKGELRKARELASIAKARQRAKKKVPCFGQGTLGDKFGGDLLSRQVTLAVPSALKSLTSVFEMGTGVAPSPLPPGNRKNHFGF